MPKIDLYQSGGHKDEYEKKAQEREGEPVVGNQMGVWVAQEKDRSLQEYDTQGRVFV